MRKWSMSVSSGSVLQNELQLMEQFVCFL